MHRVIEDNLDPLCGLCKQYRVTRLEVFGSAATDAFDTATSDVDLVNPNTIGTPYFRQGVDQTRRPVYAV